MKSARISGKKKNRNRKNRYSKNSKLIAVLTGVMALCLLVLYLLDSFNIISIGEGLKPVAGSTENKLEVHYIDVGQGDCVLIKCGEHSMLIDAGDNNKGTMVQNYLKQEGVNSLDYVVGTHPDSDHIGGLDVIIYKFDCDKVILPDRENDTRTCDDLVAAIDEKSYKIIRPVVGTEYQLADAYFTIIAPNNVDYETNNDYSVGILMKHGENTFIFTGDAEEAAEEDILANGIDISADVMKVSHHGSRSSSSEEFLDAVSPKYAVIMCGEGNDYGHPHAQTLNRLRARGIKVFRTDEQGSIIITSDGHELGFSCSSSETWQVGE